MKKNLTTGLLVLSLCISLVHGTDSKAAALRLNHKKLTLTKGSTYSLKVKGRKKKQTIHWKSGNKKVASVNKKGVITAKRKGTATITAIIKKKKLRCKITVISKKAAAANTKKQTAGSSSTKKPAVHQTATRTPTVPSGTKPPAPAKTPSSTKTPAPAKTPFFMKTPTPAKVPFFMKTPAPTKAPSSTKAPAPTKTPSSTKTPAPTKTPSSTKTPAPTKAPSSSSVTEEEAYQILISLRSTYPEGMTLTNSYYYYSPCFGNGYGCYGFAAKLSDTVFGTGTPCSAHTSFDQIKIGDVIRIGNSHSVVVLTKSSSAITVVEGNYNSSVHWGRTITKSALSKDGFKVTTRYNS